MRVPVSAAALVCALAVSLLAASDARAGDVAAGKAVYDAHCASCHGSDGKGDGPVASALIPPPRDFTKGVFKFDTDKDGKPGEDADLEAIIKKGAAAFGGSPFMAAWPTLSDADVDNVIAYIRSLKK